VFAEFGHTGGDYADERFPIQTQGSSQVPTLLLRHNKNHYN
jgi:hypothetical protein